MKIRPIQNTISDKTTLKAFYDLYADYFDLELEQNEYYKNEYVQELSTLVNQISENTLVDQIIFLEDDAIEMTLGMSIICKIDEKTCEIKRFIMLEHVRDQKLGKVFLEHVLTQAKRTGYTKAVLDVLKPKSEAAFHLYQKLGFQVYKTQSFLSENDVIFLEKYL